ncbi:MAG: tRNA adenosine(34) deaminase TadA [Actinobacteria bacterium]|jgi:tRNA(adenine34) deaminase|nr:tRNA adenosine(34) deaminase TadA [Actinomycetota bacterium]
MNDFTHVDLKMIKLAFKQAKRAVDAGEVPVGAVVTLNGSILAERYNEREKTADPSAHAEMLALRDAAAVLGTWHLEGAEVYATMEPCPMCAGALVLSRVKRLVYAVADPKAGACGSLYNLCDDPRLNHQVQVEQGLLADEVSDLLAGFFAGLRNSGS